MIRIPRLGWLSLVLLLGVVPAAWAQTDPAVVGQWGAVQSVPAEAVHAHLLPSGRVLLWPTTDNPYLWNPATGAVSASPLTGYNIFCSGHCFLPDGRLLVTGGHIQNNVGEDRTTIYNPFNARWYGSQPVMNDGRWYPTNVGLANGDVLVVSGDVDTTIGVNTLPQVFELATGQWRSLSTALLGLPLYPWMHLAPNGMVFNAGPSAQTRYLDTGAPTGAWSPVATRYRPDGSVDSFRDYGSSVLYDDGKVLVMGGGDPPTNAALTIDLGQSTPTWEPAGTMAFARRQHNATLLPDGTVLVTGGSSAPGFNTLSGAVYDTELWNPATRSWSRMVPQARPRLYHSTALLLPDGRVLSAGGDYAGATGQNVAEQNLQVYSPPYLFRGPRPAISGAPSRVVHGQTFQVNSPDAVWITQVTWLRLASVTHAFNQDQRINRLAFVPPAAGGSALAVTAPSDPNLAPPGYYMLFLLRDGVPSVARIVRLDLGAVPAPTLAALSPASAAAGTAGFELAVTGGNFVEPAAAPGGSVVRWNGSPRPTRFVSGTELRADISAADLAAAGAAPVTVANPGGTVSEAQTFTVQPRVTLTVTRTGPGAGTVTSTPAGIACGTDCQEAYARGTSVTLTAAPAAGSAFQGWSGGGCRGAALSCTVLLNADTTVTAKFRR